jgi:hypothetical protein
MAGKDAVVKPGDSAAMVQTPAGQFLLNHLLGSQGSQQYNAAAIAPGGMYDGGQMGGGMPGGGQAPMFPSQNQGRVPSAYGGKNIAVNGMTGQPFPQGGGQQASMMAPMQKMPGQAMNMMQPGGPRMIQPDRTTRTGKKGEKFQPISGGIFDQNAARMQTQLSGGAILGQTGTESGIQDYWRGQSLGGGADRNFQNAMSPMMPGMMTNMAGSLGGYGMGGYGADGMPSAMTGTQVGSGFVDQMGLEAGAQGEMRAREAAGLAASGAQDRTYLNELMRNIESEASSTLANQLPEVGAQMEAAGLGRSGSRGLASTQMGQQVLGQANRDKMSALSQFADQAAGRSFQARQNQLQRLGGADDAMLNRAGQLGLGYTGEQTARLLNEGNIQGMARGQNMDMFGIGQQNRDNAFVNAGIAESNERAIDQARLNSILGAQREGKDDLFTLTTNINQQPINYSPNTQQNPWATFGMNAGAQMLGGMFNNQPSNISG